MRWAARRASAAGADGLEHDSRLRADGARPAGLLHHQRPVRDHQARCARLPGRKSLVLFSEGLAIPPAVQRLFLGVIDAANRANVSIYAMDAAGLRAESEQAKIRDQVNAAGGAGGGTLGTAAGSGGDPLTKALENERRRAAPGSAYRARRAGAGHRRRVLHEHQQPAAGPRPHRGRSAKLLPARLHADQSGLRRPLPRDRGQGEPARASRSRRGRGTSPCAIPAARRSTSGRRRRSARSSRSRCRTRSRCAPARCSSPNAIARARPGRRRAQDRAADVRRHGRRQELHLGFHGAGALRRSGEPRRAQGQPALRSARPDRARSSAPRRATSSSIASRSCRPGVYTMETVVHDAPSGKSSVRFSTVEVPAVDPARLRMSSLMIVKRGEKVAAKERARRESAVRQRRRAHAQSRRSGQPEGQGSGCLLHGLSVRRVAARTSRSRWCRTAR